MNHTIEEIVDILMDRVDEVDLLEVLELTTEDIILRFGDRVRDRYDELCKLCDDYEDEIYEWENSDDY